MARKKAVGRKKAPAKKTPVKKKAGATPAAPARKKAARKTSRKVAKVPPRKASKKAARRPAAADAKGPRDAATVDQYLAALPDERRAALQGVRAVVRKNLPKGVEEGMQYGMIGYYVPHAVYPPGYHCDPEQPLPFAGLASQKNHMSLYLFCTYADPDLERWFREAWTAAGRKLDMGKACVRFRKLDDVPLDVVAQALRKMPLTRFIAAYEGSVKGAGKRAGKGRA